MKIIQKRSWPLAILVLFASAWIAQAGDFSGQVVSIQDGDTLKVHRESGGITKIRLWGIDAPEKRQPYSKAAKRYLSALAFGKKVKILVRDQDRYRRTVAEIILPDGRNVSQEMVKAGYAWWYRKYATNDVVLKSLEMQARTSKRGLWAAPHAIAPWEYKRMKRH